MARKREFNYDDAIEKATRLFWTRGYSNTSLRDLLDAMQIGEGSFYNIFRGKQELYLACLDYYNRVVTRRRVETFNSEKSIRKAIRKFFDIVIDETFDESSPPACLMANSLFADVLV